MYMSNWQEKPRVLIVDDDDEFMADMKILLSPEFDVTTAMGTRRAHEMLSRQRYDCLLLDLRMPRHFGDNPDLEGLSFLRHLRTDTTMESTMDMPVIVLTAFGNQVARKAAGAHGVKTLYRKPPDIKRLTAAIWNLVSKANGN